MTTIKKLVKLVWFVKKEYCKMTCTISYYPTLLRRVQIMRETSTNIARYLYSSYFPDCAKDQKPWQVRIMGKRKRWIINLLLDILVCSIAVNFYSFVFWLALWARQNTARLGKNIQRYYTLKRLIRYIYSILTHQERLDNKSCYLHFLL